MNRNFSPDFRFSGSEKFTEEEAWVLICLSAGVSLARVPSFLAISPESSESLLKKIQKKLKSESPEDIAFVASQPPNRALLRRYLARLREINLLRRKSEKTIEFFDRHERIVDRLEVPGVSPAENNDSSFREAQTLFGFSMLKQRREQLIIGMFLCFTSAATLYVAFRENPREGDFSKDFSREKAPIRSELVIPVEDVFLKRPGLVGKIENKLRSAAKTNQDIRSVALVSIVGMGGVGKTTLARYYARSRERALVWELNAETKTSLLNSFNDLAYAMATGKELKEELELIQRTKNLEQKEKQLLLFVKALLKQSKNWLLIYDNVENFPSIRKYFPDDPGVWGDGDVIITTRDGNIANSGYVKPGNAIEINELSEKEALLLFCKILYNAEPGSVSKKQKEEATRLLAKISLFPLDISVAAYYMKNMKISPEEYIKKLEKNDTDFENSQNVLLKEIGDYAKTRYAIITLSLKELMDRDPNFIDLLLLIGCVDSQNIPKRLLDECASDCVTNGFLMGLKKFSLITGDSSSLGHRLISIHRSTQKITLAYLTKSSSLGNDRKPLARPARVLESCVNGTIDYDTDLFPLMKILVEHCETFLSHKRLLTEDITRAIKIKLGSLYAWLNECEKAEAVLAEVAEDLEINDDKNHLRIFQTLTWTGMNDTWQGNYKKAEGYLERAIAIHEKRDLKNYSEIAISLIGLGYTYRHLGEYEKAKNSLERSVATIEKYLPENYSFLTQAMGQLGIVYAKIGLYKEAKKILEKISKTIDSRFSHGDARFAWCFANMGNVYKELGEYEKAKKIFELSVARLRKTEEASHWLAIRLAKDLASLADIYRETGEYQKAKELLELSLTTFRKSKNFREDHPVMGSILQCVGNIHKELGEYRKAQEALRGSVAIHENRQGRDHADTAIVLNSLGQVYVRDDQLEKGELVIKEALKILESKRHPQIYRCFENLCDLYLKKSLSRGNDPRTSEEFKEQAIVYCKHALKIAGVYFSEYSVHMTRISRKLEELSEPSL